MAATRKKREASPLEIARYGHIATALRAYLARAKIGVADMNERLGRQRKDAVIYHYLAAKGAPTEDNRKAIAKLTGIPEKELMARNVDAPPSLGTLVRVGEPGVPARPAARSGDVLSFNVGHDGEARIRLDVTMPVASAMPLLRIILDAGVAMSPRGEEE